MTEPPAYSIRQFRFPEDYPAVIALWNDSGPGVQVRRSDALEEIQKKLQRDPDLFLLAEREGQVIGTVMGGFDGRRGMIYHLAVARSFQQSGIGAVLMEEVESRMRAKGCLRSYLVVVPDQEEVIRFYEKRGWERMPHQLMGKDLD